MTAKDREIQVYEMNEDQIPSDWPRDFVAYADHLRAVKLAQIEALEEISDAADLFVASTVDRDAEWVVTQKSIATKIAALRKELEHG